MAKAVWGIAVALLMAGCDPAAQCEKGIADVKRDLEQARLDMGRAAATAAPITAAGMALSNAELQQATDNHKGCLDNVKIARQELGKLQR
jgi:hypothetical protein